MGLIAAKFILVPLTFDPDALKVFAIPKAIVGQSLGLVLLGVMIALLIRFGRAAMRITPLSVAAAALICAYLVATLFALNPVVALLGAPDDAVGLLTVLDGAILFWALSTLVRTATETRSLAVALFIPLVPVVAYELMQRLGRDPIRWAGDLGTVRPFSTFGNPDVLAHYLGTLAVGAAALLLWHQWSRWRDALPLAAVTLIGLGGVIVTFTRAAVPGFVFAGLVLIGLALWKRSRGIGGRQAVPIAAVTLAALAGLALSPVGQSFMGFASSIARAQEGAPLEGSVAARLVLYEAALREFASRPLVGVGPGNFVVAYPPNRPAGSYDVIKTYAIENSPHNWLLKIATDAGVIGLAAFGAVVIVGVATAGSRNSGSEPLVVGSLASLAYLLGAGLFTVNDAGTEWLLWAGLGVIAGAASVPLGERSETVQRPSRGPSAASRWAVAVPVVLGAIAAALALPAFNAGREAGENSRARSAGALGRSVSAGERAVSLVPYRAEYWHGLGLSLAGLERYAQAERAFTRAVELAPYHTTYLTNLSRAQVALGRDGDAQMRETAVATAELAVANDPTNVGPYVALAIADRIASRPSEAARAADTALKIGPPPSDFLFYIASTEAFLSLDRASDAERVVRVGLSLSPDRPSWIAMEKLLARALAQAGRRSEAIAEIDKVLAAAPDDVGAQDLKRQLSPP